MICATPGLVFWGEHYGDLAMRVCMKNLFQVSPYILLLRPDRAFSATTAPKLQVSYRSLEFKLVPRFPVLLCFTLFSSGCCISCLRKSVHF